MEVTLDAITVAVDDSTAIYRVRVWAPPARANGAWTVDDWELRNALDVHEVLAWADQKAGGQTFEVYVRGDEPPFVKIYGHAPPEIETTIDIELTSTI